jgi:hypothetical protein
MSPQQNPPTPLKHAAAALRRQRAAATVLLLAAWAATSMTGCGTSIRITRGDVGQDEVAQNLAVLAANYAVYEVEVSEPGLYAVSVTDLDPQAGNALVDRVRTATRVANIIKAARGQRTEPGQIGTDSFDDLAGVVWAVYGRAFSAPTAPSPAAARTEVGRTAVAAADPKATVKADSTLDPKSDATRWGARVMQSNQRPLVDDTPQAPGPVPGPAPAQPLPSTPSRPPVPAQAQLQPGKYVIRVATAFGTERTRAERLDVALVQLTDGMLIDAGNADRLLAKPVAPTGQAPAPATKP